MKSYFNYRHSVSLKKLPHTKSVYIIKVRSYLLNSGDLASIEIVAIERHLLSEVLFHTNFGFQSDPWKRSAVPGASLFPVNAEQLQGTKAPRSPTLLSHPD